jgi:hypothetical protein
MNKLSLLDAETRKSDKGFEGDHCSKCSSLLVTDVKKNLTALR